MDQKRAMLYPQVDFNTPSAPSPTPTTTPARELVGPELVPVEAPPSYDVAIGTNAVTVPAIAVTPQPPQVVYEYEQPAQQSTVVQMETLNLGPNPCRVLCPACGAQKTTRMTHTANSRTHLGAGLLCLVGWCCFACFVPYCMNSCRTGNHYCRKCNTFLGAYSPSGLK